MGSIIRFSDPWWLMGIVAGVVPVAMAIRARRRGKYVSGFSVVLQVLAIVLGVLALARPSVPLSRRAQKPYMILRDVSGSTRTQSDQTLELPADLPSEAYDFASAVVPRGQKTQDERTLLGAALRLALARAEALSGLIVWTDGGFTDETWADLATALGQTDLPVMILPMESPPVDVRIVELATQRHTSGEVALRVTLASNALTTRELTVWTEGAEDTPLLKRTLRLARETATIRLSDNPAPDSVAVYRAVLSEGDAFPENDAAAALILPTRGRVALLTREGGYRPEGLVSRLKLRVREIRPADAPNAPAGWANYAAVILIDSEGSLLGFPQRAALGEYVRGGGGLLLIGAGPHASPADRDDPLNQVAALLGNPYQRRALQITVVLDASGSMSEPAESDANQIKFGLAREAVLSLRRHLTPSDALSIITFSDTPQVIYDSAGGRIDFAGVADALGRVRCSGPTKVEGALKLATAQSPHEGREGLVLLVSDLLAEPFDASAMAKRFRGGRFSLGVVATASIASPVPLDTPLEALTESLGAPLVRSADLLGLAEVFARFLRDQRGDAIRRGEFRATVARSPFGMNIGALPNLRAYLLCAPHPGTDVLLRVATDPVLGQRMIGLGRSVSLAVPTAPGENVEWKRSRVLADLLAAAVRWILPPAVDTRFTGEIERTPGKLHIRIEARDVNGPLNLLKLTARLQAPVEGEAESSEVALLQTAPGRYEAATDAGDEPLSLIVQGSDGRVVWRHALGRTSPREFAKVGADWQKLRNLAERTGGRIISRRDLPMLVRRLAARRYTEIWYYLLAAAVAAMLSEWALTRVRRSA